MYRYFVLEAPYAASILVETDRAELLIRVGTYVTELLEDRAQRSSSQHALHTNIAESLYLVEYVP